jgi:GDP/UDP-N,N'-diacetylbacillosamine 2-epimerase (hydrolysing)
MRRVCVVTGSRADYGLLRWVIQGIHDSRALELQLVVTGMHLSPEFGLTVNEILSDGFMISKRVESILSADSPVGIAKSIGLGVIGFADALSELGPDIVVVLGDRFEIWSAAIAALPLGIVVAHIHGGERTEGAIDESIRHSLTKLSQVHFVATEEYRKRVAQLGEDPERIFTVGGLGVDALARIELLDKVTLETELGFTLGPRNIIVTFHPVTLEYRSADEQMRELFAALDTLGDTTIIFTMPNADAEGRKLKSMVEEYVSENENAHAFDSLGQRLYLSTLQYVDAVVGNSSSGLLETPSFKKPTINIGERQAGRLKATSVIDCDATRDSIVSAISMALESEFQSTLRNSVNPYGTPGASERVVAVLEDLHLELLTRKAFFDLEGD